MHAEENESKDTHIMLKEEEEEEAEIADFEFIAHGLEVGTNPSAPPAPTTKPKARGKRGGGRSNVLTCEGRAGYRRILDIEDCAMHGYIMVAEYIATKDLFKCVLGMGDTDKGYKNEQKVVHKGDAVTIVCSPVYKKYADSHEPGSAEIEFARPIKRTRQRRRKRKGVGADGSCSGGEAGGVSKEGKAVEREVAKEGGEEPVKDVCVKEEEEEEEEKGCEKEVMVKKEEEEEQRSSNSNNISTSENGKQSQSTGKRVKRHIFVPKRVGKETPEMSLARKNEIEESSVWFTVQDTKGRRTLWRRRADLILTALSYQRTRCVFVEFTKKGVTTEHPRNGHRNPGPLRECYQVEFIPGCTLWIDKLLCMDVKDRESYALEDLISGDFGEYAYEEDGSEW